MKFGVPIEWQHYGAARLEGERVRDGDADASEACGLRPVALDADDCTLPHMVGAESHDPREPRAPRGDGAARLKPEARQDERGITVVELMVVMAIVSIMMGLGAMALGSINDGDLREDAGNVAAAIKYTYSNAAINNTHYRLVFQVGGNEYYSEIASSGVERTVKTSGTNNTEDYLTEEAQRLADKVEEERDLFADEEENPFGVNRKVSYERVEDAILDKTRLHEGVRFTKIIKAGSDEEYTSGTVSMSFFPNGFQEQVFILMETTDGAKIALVTEPLTGRVLTFTNTEEPPEGFGEIEEDE